VLQLKRRLKTAHSKLIRGHRSQAETTLLLLGKQLSWKVADLPINTDFRKVGFKVFSQWDEDGIIQYLISKLPVKNHTFIEFGVENYQESNTRFLLMNDHWQGLVLEASSGDIEHIRKDPIYWQYDLQAKNAWITRSNIDSLLSTAGFDKDVGLLSIDVDGNDYWIWDALSSVRPRIVIVEYNSLFGIKPVVVPYREDFDRTKAHFSRLYYGSSLGALNCLAKRKGYILLGSNVWGHNAFFVRSDVAGNFRPVAPEQAYVASKFRESRGRDGRLTYLRDKDRITPICEMPLFNVETGYEVMVKDVCI
jgi:hypothetical protein